MTLRRLRPLTAGVRLATSRKYRTTSTVVVGPDRSALLVDPAWTPDELEGLASDLAVLRLRLVGALSTHGHYDHVLWHRALPEVPRWGSAATSQLSRSERGGMLAALGPGYPTTLYAEQPEVRPLPGVVVPWSGPRVTAVVTDAHELGHTAWWIEREGVLLAGDLLSDDEVPLLAESDPSGAAYRSGLAALEPFVRRARFVVPGHGSPTRNGLARLHADFRWLDALDAGTPPDDPRMSTPDNVQEWERQRARRT